MARLPDALGIFESFANEFDASVRKIGRNETVRDEYACAVVARVESVTPRLARCELILTDGRRACDCRKRRSVGITDSCVACPGPIGGSQR